MVLARNQATRLEKEGFKLSKNDLKVILFGQLLKGRDVNITDKEMEALLKLII